MIANLYFEKTVRCSPVESPMEPGLHRIDELLTAVLARYEQVESTELPSLDFDHFGRERGESVADRRCGPAKVYAK